MRKGENMFGFIYETTNKKNGKTYVGLCTHENPIKEGVYVYLGSGTVIKNAVKRYGKKNFSRKILQVCDTKEELLQAEYDWIEKLQPAYNLREGGYAGISNEMKDYWGSMTPEERKNARNWASHDMSGQNNPMYGKSTSKIVKKTWEGRDAEYREKFGKTISKTRKERGVAAGKNNPMYGRSAIREQNLKWYTDGENDKYVTEGTQPDGWWRGRSCFKKKKR